jgi:hypothetical protein
MLPSSTSARGELVFTNLHGVTTKKPAVLTYETIVNCRENTKTHTLHLCLKFISLPECLF